MKTKMDCEFFNLKEIHKKCNPVLYKEGSSVLYPSCYHPKNTIDGKLFKRSLCCNIENDYCPHNPSNKT